MTAMKPCRVLVVSPIASHPATQGNSARILSFGEELKRRNIACDFFYYGMEGLTETQAEAMKAFWNRFFFMKSLPHDEQSLPSAWGLDDWCPAALCENVAKVAAEQRYDAILVNYVWMSRVLEAIEGPLKIIDTHDIFGDRQRVAQESGLEPRWFFTSEEEERRGFARADLVIGIQDKETETIRSRFDGLAMTVGHPTEPHFLVSARRAAPFFTFGYLGSGNPFNIASIRALDQAIAGLSLPPWTVAGSISARLPSLASRPTRLGIVERLEDFYDHVECVLNPMLGGTGLKIKTIEALAYGARVIGTKDAFEGLDAEHPLHQLDSMEQMARGIADYAGSPALRRELELETYRLFARYMASVGSAFDNLAQVMRRGAAVARQDAA
ncbi:glycosyltransferase [Bosea thiooxidans]